MTIFEKKNIKRKNQIVHWMQVRMGPDTCDKNHKMHVECDMDMQMVIQRLQIEVFGGFNWIGKKEHRVWNGSGNVTTLVPTPTPSNRPLHRARVVYHIE